MGNRKKWIFNIFFLIVTLGITGYAIFHDENPRAIYRMLDQANGWYWIPCFFLVLIFISGESLILRLLLTDIGENPPKGHCLVYSFIGFFFSCITPAAGGGQPAQVIYMRKRDGINPGKTAPILMVITICYKFVLVFYGFLVLILRPAELLKADTPVIIWCFACWIVNALIVLFFLVLIFKTALVERFLRFLMRIASGHISEEKLLRWDEKISRTIDNYHKVTHGIRHNTRLFFLVMLISILQRTVLFSITWFVLRSFGIHTSVGSVFLLQSLVSLGADMLPLPGGSGANEALFVLLFESICSEVFVLPVMIVSRGISYYSQLVICGIIFFIAYIRLERQKSKERANL